MLPEPANDVLKTREGSGPPTTFVEASQTQSNAIVGSPCSLETILVVAVLLSGFEGLKRKTEASLSFGGSRITHRNRNRSMKRSTAKSSSASSREMGNGELSLE